MRTAPVLSLSALSARVAALLTQFECCGRAGNLSAQLADEQAAARPEIMRAARR